MQDFLFESERLGIRRFLPTDAEDFAEILTDEITSYFEPYEAFSEQAALKEAERLTYDERFFAVILKDSGKLIGKIYFESMKYFGSYEIGYSFNRSFWGNGYASEAVGAMFKYAFEKMKVRRIYAEADVRNERSVKLLERAGMRREGTFIKSAYFQKDENGKPVWSDFACFALLSEDFFGNN